MTARTAFGGPDGERDDARAEVYRVPRQAERFANPPTGQRHELHERP